MSARGRRRAPVTARRAAVRDLSEGPASAPDQQPGGARFRPELHGLRGVAILLVVLYHVWFDRVSGGVDVFLFLSAFLLTGTFVRRAESGAPLRPFAYWARTFKRLLPPTVVVALGTLAAVRLLLPAGRWMDAIADAIASILQVENWALIRRGVDYYAAAETAPTPFQHFWSLSVQGQIFLAFPLVITACALIARRLRRPLPHVLVPVLLAVTAASFAWSVLETATAQQIAYFDTTARVWEFSAGGLLAIALPRIEQRRERALAVARRARRASRPVTTGMWSRRLRLAAGWIGLLGLISCGVLVNVRGAFPGWIAAWPLAAAALVLLAGRTGARLGADRLLSTRPAAVLGDISYGLYLVHWPLLTLWLQATGASRAGWRDGALVIALSLAAAWLLTRIVDTPIRRWPWANARPLRAAGVVAATLVIGLAPAIGAQRHLLSLEQEARARAIIDNPGARVLDAGDAARAFAAPGAELLPTAALIGRDWVGVPEPCTGRFAPLEPELTDLCRMTAVDDPAAPVLVIVGNSRVEQLSGALLPLAAQHGWRVITVWKGGCVYAPDARTRAECDAYSDATAEYIERVRPRAVATTTTFFTQSGEEVVGPGMATTIPALARSGTGLIALRDSPRLREDPMPCLEENGQDPDACTEPLPAPLRSARPDAEILAEPGVRAVGLNDLICPDEHCAPVIGNVLVWIDRNHVSGTYAASMQDALEARLRETGWRW